MVITCPRQNRNKIEKWLIYKGFCDILTALHSVLIASIHDKRDGAAAVGTLVLGAAGDEQLGVADHAASAPHTKARAWRVEAMSLSSSMVWRKPRSNAAAAGLRLGQERHHAVRAARGELAGGGEPEARQHGAHRLDVDAVGS